ncbi:T9SS type A sorting domain-containing protein [Gilvibacter sp.]|uniref:T9SS type A sorting domain-containing protein n=1 Tax=Gilvibacter sp. TaxID=2729997 RepID=UPI003B52ACD9
MKKLLFLLLVLPASSLFGQAVNDECADRLTISPGVGGFNEFSIDTSTATESLDASCETASQVNLDVWYEFTMPVSGNLRVTNVPNTVRSVLYDSCSGTELACFGDDGFFYNLVGGTTYVYRLSERDIFAGSVNFRMEAFASATNDECANRQALTVSTATTTVTPLDYRAATESVDGPCETASQDQLDLWYEFTMPVNGNIRITGIPNTVFRTLYDSCGGVDLACASDDGFFYNLTSGTTYVLRMSERSLFASADNFTIQAFETAANDECVNRNNIIVNTGSVTNTTLDFRTATESVDGPCETAGNTQHDLWYEFTMPVNGNIRITNIPNTVYRTLYDTCGGVDLACGADDGFFYDLTAGTTYVLRMSERGLFASADDFDIEAFETAANDECADRIGIVVGTAGVTNTSLDFRAATESVNGPCETAGNTQQDLWYEFIMPVNGNIRITNIPNTVYRTLYDSCGGVDIACGADDGFFYNLTAGTTYVLRMSERGLFASPDDFDIQAFEAAVNDDCAEATAMVVGTVSPIVYSIDFRGATESTDGSCDTAGNTNLDVWYTVEMPVDGSLDLSGVPNTVNFTLYDSCGGTELDCFSDDGSFTGLSAGEQYLLRLRERALFASFRTVNVVVTPDVLGSCSSSTTWSGGSWSAGVPDKTTSAIIADNYDTATQGSISACECTINTGVTLTVGAGDYLETSFNIIVDGTLDVAHEGSVVQMDPTAQTINNGSINVRKSTPVLAAKDFMLMASPMSAESRDGVYSAAWRAYGHNAANFSPNPDVALAFPSAEVFIDDNGDDRILLGATAALNAGTGYLVFPQATPTEAGLSYDLDYTQGTLNSGNIAFPIVYNGSRDASFNLMGNPYPSTLDAVDFIQANAMIDAVYLWEHNTAPSAGLPGYLNFNYSMEDVSVYNLTGGIAAASSPSEVPTRYIASGQGFAVKATAAGTAEFNNGMRRNFNNNTLRSTAESVLEGDRIWIQLQAAAYQTSSTALVGFLEGQSEAVNPGYDAKRLATYVSVYSHTRSGDELGIQALGRFDDEQVISLGISSQLRGFHEFSISASQLKGVAIERSDLYLYDTEQDVWTDLNQTGYHFTADEGNHPFRFELHFKRPTTSGLATSMKAYPNPTSGNVMLQAEAQEITGAKLYDMLGRLLWSTERSFTQMELDLSNFPKATYLLHYQTAGTWQVTQIVVR